MEVQIAVAKLPKYALRESGDTVEVVERPRGGLTVIMADGQTHGQAAKRVSHLVVTKAAQLIADGVRDGAVARGVHDHLFAARDGKVSTELTMVSVDLRTKSLVITRNTHVPVLVLTPEGEVQQLAEHVEPIGVHEVMKPVISEFELRLGTVVLAFTDGVYSAGRRSGNSLVIEDLTEMMLQSTPDRVSHLANSLLDRALQLDHGRPADDMAVLVVGLGANQGDDLIRRMHVSLTI